MIRTKAIKKLSKSREREGFRYVNSNRNEQYSLFRPTDQDIQLDNGQWTTIYTWLGFIPQLINRDGSFQFRERGGVNRHGQKIHKRNKVVFAEKEINSVPLPMTLRHKNPIELDAMCDEFIQMCGLPETISRRKKKQKFINFHMARQKLNQKPEWAGL